MIPLSSTNHFHHVFLFSVYFVLYSVTTGSDDLSVQYKRPMAEVDPDAIILRTRGGPRSRSTVLTTSPDPQESYDPSFSLDEQEDNFLAFWNFSSEAGGDQNEETTGELPAQDRGATLEELVIRLEEVALDDAIENAMSARRGRPTSRIVAPGRGVRRNFDCPLEPFRP